MRAVMMPGGPVADAVFGDLEPRIAELIEGGHMPGLATVLIGDDDAARYVGMKMQKAEELGATAACAPAGDAPPSRPSSGGGVQRRRGRRDARAVPRSPQVDFDGAVGGRPGQGRRRHAPHQRGPVGVGIPGPVACTPAGIEAFLAYHEVPVSGREVVILGGGDWPAVGILLSQKRPTANAAVTGAHRGGGLARYTRRADILVAAAGVPGIQRSTSARRGGRRWRSPVRGAEVAAGRGRVV